VAPAAKSATGVHLVEAGGSAGACQRRRDRLRPSPFYQGLMRSNVAGAMLRQVRDLGAA